MIIEIDTTILGIELFIMMAIGIALGYIVGKVVYDPTPDKPVIYH